jgi:hypothetical protein
MSIYTSTLSKFAFADAIASAQVKTMTEDSERRSALIRMQIAARNLLVQWPGRMLTSKELYKLHKRLKLFTHAAEWEYTQVHIQSMINFCLSQLVELIENHITDPHRMRLLTELGDAEAHVYRVFSDETFDQERPECIDEGLKTAWLWKQTVEA